jgi:hypothetical protein
MLLGRNSKVKNVSSKVAVDLLALLLQKVYAMLTTCAKEGLAELLVRAPHEL